MSYVALSLVAVVSYGLVPPLVKLANRQGVPAESAVVLTNSMLVLICIVWARYRQVPVTAGLTVRSAVPLLAAGLLLGIAIICYYIALSAGPVSIVVPIYSLFLVVSSLTGWLFLREELTATRLLGLVFALAAIYLVARDGPAG